MFFLLQCISPSPSLLSVVPSHMTPDLSPSWRFSLGHTGSLPQHTNWRLLRSRVELVGRLLSEVYGGCAGSGLTVEAVVKVIGWNYMIVSSTIQQPLQSHYIHYVLACSHSTVHVHCLPSEITLSSSQVSTCRCSCNPVYQGRDVFAFV